MADEQQLHRLKAQGVDAWNAWRKQAEDVLVDLSMADFRTCNLSNANLGRADLTDADLSSAILKGADLTKADLSGANLTWTDLTDADLSSAILKGVDLGTAKLDRANLNEAVFGSPAAGGAATLRGESTLSADGTIVSADDQRPEEESSFIDQTTPSRGSNGQAAIGRAARYLREPEGAALDIRRTALAIARLIRTADGEFSLAIFGRWGIGKTRLMQEVAPLLADPRAYAQALEASLHLTARPGRESDSYKVVRFSAWQYRKPPESWVFLLESFVETVRSLGFLERTGILLRRLTLSVGPLGTLTMMFGVAMAFGQSALITVLLAVVAPAISFGALLYLFLAARAGRAQLAPALARLTQLSNHAERLGLQAAVGADLKRLLRAWAPHGGSYEAWSSWLIQLVGLLLIGAMWGWGLSAGGITKAIQFTVLRSACDQLHSLLPALAAGPPCVIAVDDEAAGGGWARWTMFGAWVAAGMALLWALRPWPRRVQRMLLVVDDLDRCEAEEMLGQIEAVKLLIEDPEVHGRVQVVALVDEDVLRSATAAKFAELAAARKVSSETLVEEHFEKLFLCHFRLHPLTAKQAGEFLDHLTGWAAVKGGDIGKRRSTVGRRDRQEETRPTDGKGPPHVVSPTSRGFVAPIRKVIPAEEPLLTEEERTALRAALPVSEPGPTPRTLMAYRTRYLLARSLMQLAETPVDPDVLARDLAQACFGKKRDELPVGPFGSAAWAVAQVC